MGDTTQTVLLDDVYSKVPCDGFSSFEGTTVFQAERRGDCSRKPGQKTLPLADGTQLKAGGEVRMQ